MRYQNNYVCSRAFISPCCLSYIPFIWFVTYVTRYVVLCLSAKKQFSGIHGVLCKKRWKLHGICSFQIQKMPVFSSKSELSISRYNFLNSTPNIWHTQSILINWAKYIYLSHIVRRGDTGWPITGRPVFLSEKQLLKLCYYQNLCNEVVDA